MLLSNQDFCEPLHSANPSRPPRCHLQDSTGSRVAIPRSVLNRSLIMRAATHGNGHYRLSPVGHWRPIRREDLPRWPKIPDIDFWHTPP